MNISGRSLPALTTNEPPISSTVQGGGKRRVIRERGANECGRELVKFAFVELRYFVGLHRLFLDRKIGRRTTGMWCELRAGMMASRWEPPRARHPGSDRPLGRLGGVIGKGRYGEVGLNPQDGGQRLIAAPNPPPPRP
jgi:hypothetical protein